jgi:hypothetical protein
MISRKNFAAAMYISGKKIFPSTAELSPPLKTTTPQAGPKMGRGGENLSHTPGPWHPFKNSAGTWEAKLSPDMLSHTVAFAGSGCPEYFRGDQEANIRLAAEAPELLEHLEAALKLLETADFRYSLDKFCRIREAIHNGEGIEAMRQMHIMHSRRQALNIRRSESMATGQIATIAMMIAAVMAAAFSVAWLATWVAMELFRSLD